jgi:hypothetical protein
MIHRPFRPWRLRTSSASKIGAPQAVQGADGGECAARAIHRVSAVEGFGVAAIRSRSAVTPEACAARVSLRLATRSSFGVSPQTSSTTAPSASQASASAEACKVASTSAVRTVTRLRGSRPSSARPLIDSAPASRSQKSWRIQSSGRRGATRPARPATNPVAAALCRPASANTSWTAPIARPPCSAASASAWPRLARRGRSTSPCASIRSMRPRKVASVLRRALVMRRFPRR